MEWGTNPNFNPRAEEDSYAKRQTMTKFKKGDTISSLTDIATDIFKGGLYIQLQDNDKAVFRDNAGVLRYRPGDEYRVVEAAAKVPEKPEASVTGRKDDGGKLDMNLLDDMPRAIRAVVEVMQWAVTEKKPVPYERGSWLGVHADRYRAAIKRHDRAAAEQASRSTQATRFQRDDETGLLHLAHQACSAMMALENTLRELEVR